MASIPFSLTTNSSLSGLRLSHALAEFGGECVLETLKHLPQLKANALVQDDSKACKAPKITFNDGVLDLSSMTAQSVFHVGNGRPRVDIIARSSHFVFLFKQRWQALSDSVGVSVLFQDKVVKLIDLRLPASEELQYGLAAVVTVVCLA